jgi:hypothetical protein
MAWRLDPHGLSTPAILKGLILHPLITSSPFLSLAVQSSCCLTNTSDGIDHPSASHLDPCQQDLSLLHHDLCERHQLRHHRSKEEEPDYQPIGESTPRKL